MRGFRRVLASVLALVFTASMLVSAAPVSAASQEIAIDNHLSQDGAWVTTAKAAPGGIVNSLVRYANATKVNQKGVKLVNKLPAGAVVRPNSVYLTPAGASDGVQQADTPIVTTGLPIGLLKPGEKVEVQFQMILAGADHYTCGQNHQLNKVMSINSNGKVTNRDSSELTVVKNCSTTPATNPNPNPQPLPDPVFSCTNFKVYRGANHQVRIKSVRYVLKHGPVFKGALIDWGDGSIPTATTKPVGTPHTYAADGRYEIRMLIYAEMNGSALPLSCDSEFVTFKTTSTPSAPSTPDTPSAPATPATPVTPNPATPAATTGQVQSASTANNGDAEVASKGAKDLPNTGPGSILMIALLATLTGIVGSRLLLARMLRG